MIWLGVAARRSHRIECYLPAGTEGAVDRDKILNHMTAGLITALCSTQPELYVRHRWTGSELATDDLGILESCHQLLSTTSRRFVLAYQPALAKTLPARPLQQPAAIQDADIGGAGAEREGEREEGDNHAAVNARNRQIAFGWTSSQPLGKLVLSRLIMEPLRQLLSEQFRISGAEWAKQQECLVAKAIGAGLDPTRARQYRLSIAASCRDEACCTSHIALVSHQHCFRISCLVQHSGLGKALAARVIINFGFWMQLTARIPAHTPCFSSTAVI